MKSPRRVWLERLMRQKRVMSEKEFANLLQLWAKKPELLWDDGYAIRYAIRHRVSTSAGVFDYEYPPYTPGSVRGGGYLKMPDGRQVAVITEYDTSGRVISVRLSVDAHISSDPRQLHVAAIWNVDKGLRLAVNERSSVRRKRMCRVMRQHYGWSVASAMIAELILMYFTHVLPDQIIVRSRNIDISDIN